MTIDYRNVVSGKDNFLDREKKIALRIIRWGCAEPGDFLFPGPNGAIGFEHLESVGEKISQPVRITLGIEPWPYGYFLLRKNGSVVPAVLGCRARNSQAANGYKQRKHK